MAVSAVHPRFKVDVQRDTARSKIEVAAQGQRPGLVGSVIACGHGPEPTFRVIARSQPRLQGSRRSAHLRRSDLLDLARIMS